MGSILQDEMTGNLTEKVRPLSSEWFISFKDPRILWEEHWFALSLEIANAVILYQIFRHAKRRGNESFYLVLSSLFSVLCFELLPLIPRPGYQLWWYHQGSVNFVKKRVPSYVVSTFAILHYIAYNLTRDSKLPTLTRSLVTALCGVAMYFPCLWMAPRLLLTFLHFDDIVFKDQILGVPCIQILISFFLFLHTSHVFIQNVEAIEMRDRNTFNHLWCSVVSGFGSGIYALVEQYVLYIWISLTCQGHAGLCILAALVIVLSLVKSELKSLQFKSYTSTGVLKPLTRKAWWAAVGVFVFTSTLPLWLNTENLKSNGNRMELGPCHIKHEVSNTSPLEVARRRFVCPEDGETLNFDFHCVDSETLQTGVRNNVNHYTICGKPFNDPYHTAKQIAAYSAICLVVFYNLMRLSFNFTCPENFEIASTKVQ